MIGERQDESLAAPGHPRGEGWYTPHAMTHSSRLCCCLVSLVVVMAAGGCSGNTGGANDSNEREAIADRPGDGPVIALLERSNFWPTAIVTGHLTERQGCLLIDDAVAVFPVSTEWDPPSVRFRNGDSVEVDSRVRLGGGWFPIEGVTQEDLPLMPVSEVRECARRTGATQYVWAAPPDLV
jgi:hypothetical protein